MEQAKYKANILVVDDEEDICEILQYNLEKAGYSVKTALSSEEALALFSDFKFDLMLLDIMLGGISGLKLAKLLREDYKNNIPIIFVTALDTEDDVLKGFASGGDDYVSKPFSVNEVVARVGAVLSRSGGQLKSSAGPASSWTSASGGAEPEENPMPESSSPQEEIKLGILEINSHENRVFVSGTEVMLTRKEMEILLLLARNAGKLFSRKDILEKVWKESSFVLERTVDVHIARLRKKLSTAGEIIQNRSGYGYCIYPQDK